jgi:hypothetical protein
MLRLQLQEAEVDARCELSVEVRILGASLKGKVCGGEAGNCGDFDRKKPPAFG